ncbi:PRPH2 [Branchiostoma lanceolatum]|uniref:PRPH2 protein n=1 Tax=Branchiostoma lanceolatum TaxID=7740 RepID=A0A8K0ES01_BRALA|nr:PRPH2 [Branchiostoma lanceolatum]
MVFVIKFTEEKRVRLATVLQCFNAISTLCSLFLVAGGIFIKARVEDKVALIENYGSVDGLCYTLIVFGLLGVGLNLFGIKVSSDSKDPETRSKGMVMLLYMGLTALYCLLVFCAGITTFAHKMHLRHAFDKGITGAMNKYQYGGYLKAELDLLQMQYRCCGSEGPEDWFRIQWINKKYLNRDSPRIISKMTDGRYTNADVPFSCCNMRYNRPCIHHSITTIGRHYNFQYRGSQKHIIYQTGCKEALMAYFGGQVLETVGGTIMVIWVFQLAVAFGVRYLQTAIKSIDPADPTGDSEGHLLPPGQKAKDTEGGNASKKGKEKKPKTKKFGKIKGKFGKNKKKPVPPEPDYDQVPVEEPLEWTLDPADSSFDDEPAAGEAPPPPAAGQPPPPPPPP